MNSRPSTDAWTISALLSWTTQHLARAGVEEPRLSAEVLLAHVAGWRRIDLYARFDSTLDVDKTTRFRELVRRAAQREPIAYLVGHKEFFSLPFLVSSSVLIPRPETETLVEFAIEHAQSLGWSATSRVNEACYVLDACTGSGCVGVSVAANLPQARVIGSDISGEALEVAQVNAKSAKVDQRVTFVQADLLSIPVEVIPVGGFDIILCNPPYVSHSGWEQLHDSVRRYEPKQALTDLHDGLSFYRRMGESASTIMSSQGVVAMEVGDHQAEAAIKAILAAGSLRHVLTRKDRTVGMPRVIAFCRSGSQ